MVASIDAAAIEVTEPEVPLEHLEHEICELSAHLSAAMCKWLLLVAEFDRREGWGHQGAKSCAQWLSWRCGLSLVSGRAHLRVAHRLAELPLLRAAFAAGELSYSKVRAVARIATPATEAPLVELARHATAAHMDRIARARRSVVTGDDEDEARRRHEARHVHWFWDEDGSLVLTARLGPDEGALLLQALDAADHALRDRAGDDDAAASPEPATTGDDPAGSPSPADPDPGPDTTAWPEPIHDPAGSSVQAPATDDAAAALPDHACLEPDDAAASPEPIDDPAGSSPSLTTHDAAASPQPAAPVNHQPEDTVAAARRYNAEAARVPASRADALVAMAETMLAHGPAARDGGERYQVVVTVGQGALGGTSADEGGEIDDGPWLAPEAARRLACDSTVVAISLGAGGQPLNVGRATPTVPRHIRRALRTRDGGCRFPGCGQRRFVDAHHVEHWARGGETSLANTCLLCRFHHHAVHEGGFGLERTPAGDLVFTTPDGAVLPAAPEIGRVTLDLDDVNHRLGVVIGSETGACLWGGERLDLGLSIDALLCLEGRIGA